VPAEFVIRYLRRCAGKTFAFDIYFHGRSLEHILAPVLSLDFTRRGVKASLIINEVELDRPPLAAFAPDGGQVRDNRCSIFELHGGDYMEATIGCYRAGDKLWHSTLDKALRDHSRPALLIDGTGELCYTFSARDLKLI
jgi:hypothetical protein